MNAAVPGGLVQVVDDDPSFRSAVTRMLRAGGFEVRAFASAVEFLQFLEASRDDAPGCVILDLRMPGLNGLELQEALARLGNPLPLIFLTGHGDIPTSVRAVKNGAEDFLTKPVKRDQLFDAVQRALARAVQEQSGRRRRRALSVRFGALTPREREVLTHVLRGRLNKQIAADLGTVERTIKAHRSSIMAKLGVQSVAELAQLAREAGFPDDGSSFSASSS